MHICTVSRKTFFAHYRIFFLRFSIADTTRVMAKSFVNTENKDAAEWGRLRSLLGRMAKNKAALARKIGVDPGNFSNQIAGTRRNEMSLSAYSRALRALNPAYDIVRMVEREAERSRPDYKDLPEEVRLAMFDDILAGQVSQDEIEAVRAYNRAGGFRDRSPEWIERWWRDLHGPAPAQLLHVAEDETPYTKRPQTRIAADSKPKKGR